MYGLPFAVIVSSYFWWLGGQGAIYAKAYMIGFILFVIMFVGLTSRIAATIIKGKEGRKIVEFFDEIVDDPDAFIARHPRLLVSLHKQTASQFPPLSVRYHPPQRRDPRFHIWEDIAELRRSGSEARP